MKTFIQDQERVLDSANDLLKTAVYADNLVKLIENTPQDKVFTIGVFGGWGTGKSSIIKTAQEKIEKETKGVKFITYDAWKYANDSFRRMFLLKVQQELKIQQTDEMVRFYQSETAEAKPKIKLNAKGLSIAVAILLIISVVVLFFMPNTDIKWKVNITTIGTLGTLLIALINGCFYDLKLSINNPIMFAPEQFEACFKEMMSICLKHKNFFQKIWSIIKSFVKKGEGTICEIEKLIIVIDNIDRCPSDMAYQLLTDVKTFLSNEEYNLVFVVPVDDEALKKHLFRRLNKGKEDEFNINKEKEEFLRKFFNVTLRIKPHQETDLHHFAHEIDKENNLGYNNDTLAIVAKEFADNPRRIIQLLNNLSGELALYEDEFVAKYETSICAILILQEEYSEFYYKATRNLDVIRKFSENEAKDKNGDINDSLLAFMRVCDVILKRTPLDALQRIFTNTYSIFCELPSDIQKSVRSYDTFKVVEFANENQDKKNNVVDYIQETLNNDVKYGATTQTTQWIDFLSQLYKNGLFDASRFSTIDNALSPYYKIAIPAINKTDALCYMGSQMNFAGFISLRNSIIEFLTAEKSTEDSNFENVLKAYYANFKTEQDCRDIASIVESYYVDKAIEQDIDFSDTQMKLLFSDSFIYRQIESIIATYDDFHIENIIWCIKNSTDFSSEIYTDLFAKYIELFGNTRGKKKDEFLTFISHLQVLFDVMPTRLLTNELSDIFDVVTSARAIPNPSWPNQSQHDTNRSILDEVDEEDAKFVTSFCYEVMRITGGNVDISAAISKLYTKCKDSIVEGALKINNIGISTRSLSAILIKVDDFDSVNDLKLLEVVLTRQDDGRLELDDDTIKTKIRTLVDNSDKNGVEMLLKKLVADKQILDMIAEYVASLDSKGVNTLPVSIAKYAVSTFKRENAETYKDNAAFLIVVLEFGTAIQKKEVVRLMKDKINNERDLDNVVSVLDHLVTEDKNMLKSLVGYLEEIKNSEFVEEAIKERVAELVQKLSVSIKESKHRNK